MHVYHSSKTQGLTLIEPRISTHEKSWVYAMAHEEHAALFLGDHNDFIIQIDFGDDMPVPHITERFEGALDYSYHNKKGSIYTLDGIDFKGNMTSFSVEMVCGHACDVLSEKPTDDALDIILALESAGKIIIHRYPDAAPWTPTDKSDLIEKAVEWSQIPGSTALEVIEKFHPDIVDQVKKRLIP